MSSSTDLTSCSACTSGCISPTKRSSWRMDTDSESDEEPPPAKRQRTTDPQTNRTGGAHDGGQQFEIKMAALTGLRGMQRGDNFELATNVKDAGNFDDLVYTINGRRYFLQLKHTENPDTTKFQPKELVELLRDCFDSYYSIQDRDKSEFIIYTNKRLGWKLSGHKRKETVVDTVEEVFKTSAKGEIFNFARDKNTKLDVYSGVEKLVRESKGFRDLSASEQKRKVSMVSEFLQKLIMVTGQKGQLKLDKVIYKEIKKGDEIKVGRKVCEQVLRNFKTCIEDWWRKRNENMTQEILRTWLQEAKTASCISVVSSLFASCTKNLAGTGINFSDSEISRLQAEIPNNSAVHLRSDALTLCSILLLDCLGTSKSIFVNLESLQSHKNMLLYAWLGGQWEWLIVSCDSAVQQSDISDACLKISEIIKRDPSNKRVIILTEYSVPQVRGFEPIEHKFKFQQLSKESQEMVLDKTIDFQGCEVTMRSVLQQDGDVEHVLVPELVTDLVTEGNVNIGGKLQENYGYYAPRVLERKIYLHVDILKDTDMRHDVFAVSGMIDVGLSEFALEGEAVAKFIELYKDGARVAGLDERDVDKEARFFALESSDLEACYSMLCERYSEKAVHWLELGLGNLLWIRSRGAIDTLLKYVDAGKTRVIIEYIKTFNGRINEESIWDAGERRVLVVAEPGMGKSSTTTHVARHTKERDPTSWVVRINWNDHSKKLQEIKAETFNLDTLVEFLCSAALPESKYTDINRSLLKQALQSSGNVTVLMDGFDEISPQYADKAAVILSELMKTKVGRLWVTSRPVEKERLEKELSVTAFNMKRLSDEHQRGMLWNLLRHKADGKERELEMLTDSILQSVERSVQDRYFTGCPLYITMIAAVCETDMETCLYSEDRFLYSRDRFLPKIDLVNLYETFVERTLHIYLTEKQKADISNSSVLDVHEDFKQSLLTNFEKCALAAILPATMLESLDNKEIQKEIQPFLDRVQAGEHKTGIVMNVVNGKPQFVHRTFAEYFAARWFSKKFKSNRSVLEHILLGPGDNFVRGMFNRILARDCPLIWAVLEGDKERLRTLLSEESVVDAVDKGGRNLMHLLATTCVTGVVDLPEIVRQYAVSLNTRDCVLQWTPLQYAIKSENWGFVVLLLKNNVDTSGLYMIRKRAHDTDYIDEIVEWALFCDSVLLLEFLRNIGVNIQQAMSRQHPSALYLAIYAKAVLVVRWLIQHGADCNTKYSDGQTPLFHAVTEGSLDVVRVLVEEGGVSVDVRDDCGRTAIDWAKDRVSELNKDGSWRAVELNDIIEYLRERGCTESSTAQQNNDTGMSIISSMFELLHTQK